MPELLSQTILFAISRYIHLLAMVVAVGGTFALRYVVLPSLADQEDSTQQAFHVRARALLFRVIVTAIVLLLVSGTVNLIRAFSVAPAPPVAYHMILGLKLLCAFALFVFALALVYPSTPPNAFQRRRRFWLTMNAHLGFLIIALSVALRFLSGK